MEYSTQERISHVARRLGFGVEPGIVENATGVEDAISAALDLSGTTPEPDNLVVPSDLEEARTPEQRAASYLYWFTQMVTGPRRIEERLAWFWHDHFATSIRKVNVPYLMFTQHLTIRRHATGSFADLLYAIATDPAMLVYLDGRENQKGAINENFGREVMELFTLGHGNYTEADVLASSSAFSGWVVAGPGPRARRLGVEPWTSAFVPDRHDTSSVTFLGRTGSFDAADAVEILLEQDATAAFIGTKLYRELVGLEPDTATTSRIAAAFREEYEVMDLVEAIVADPLFISDAAIRAKVRTPIERAAGIAQALDYRPQPDGRGNVRALAAALERVGYLPFNPPHVAGYRKGSRLLGPYGLVHGFDLAVLIPQTTEPMTAESLTQRLGLFDVTPETRAVLESAEDPGLLAALALNAPEYIVV
jgi:uncharacterized protein (DUF1800 family)